MGIAGAIGHAAGLAAGAFGVYKGTEYVGNKAGFSSNQSKALGVSAAALALTTAVAPQIGIPASYAAGHLVGGYAINQGIKALGNHFQGGSTGRSVSGGSRGR